MSFDQLRVVGPGLLIWDSGLFVCLLDNSCQRPTSFHVAYLGPTLFSSLLWERLDHVVPAIWGGEVISIHLHPPSVFSSAQNAIQDRPISELPRGLHLCSYSPLFLTCPGIGAEGADISPADGDQGRMAQGFPGPWAVGEQFPQDQRSSTVVRNTPSQGECGTGDHTLSFLFTVIVC